MAVMKRKAVQVVVVENRLIMLCDDGTMWLGQPADAPDVAWRQMTMPPDTAETGPVGFGTARR
jgi:hypothetical protein